MTVGKAEESPTDAHSEAVSVHPVAAADAAIGRIAARLGIEYFLRTAQVISRDGDGDLITAIVLYAILAANVGYLDQGPKEPGRFAGLEDKPPDEVRRPVSILAVAGSLGMPYETTRRYVTKLMKSGRCVRVQGGVFIPASALQGAADDSDTLTNVANLRRLYRGLKRAGMDLG
jgi:hypothetical protein